MCGVRRGLGECNTSNSAPTVAEIETGYGGGTVGFERMSRPGATSTRVVPLVSGRRGWQGERDSSAAARTVLRPDATAMGFDEGACDCEPEARSG